MDREKDELDKLLGLKAGEADVEEEDPGDEEETETPGKKDGLEDDGEPDSEDSESDSEDDEEESDDDEDADDDDEDDEEDDEEDEEDGEELTDESKRNKALLREITKLRQRSRRPTAPAPAQTTAAPVNIQPKPPKRIPVVMSNDGKQVFVDPVALKEMITEEAQQIAQREARVANTPDAESVRVYNLQMADQEFISHNPKRNRAVVERANQADDFISLHIGELVQGGMQFTNLNQVVQALTDRGVDKKVAKFFPEVGPLFKEFVIGRGKGEPEWRTSIHERMVTRIAKINKSPKPDKEPNSDRLNKTPRTLATKGGRDKQKTTGDQAEFRELERQFEGDPIKGLSEKQYNRYKYLGKKMKIEGMDDM